jgi:hypothetical protein
LLVFYITSSDVLREIPSSSLDVYAGRSLPKLMKSKYCYELTGILIK